MSLPGPGYKGQTFLNLDFFKLLACARSHTSANTHLASIYHLMPSMHIVPGLSPSWNRGEEGSKMVVEITDFVGSRLYTPYYITS